MGGRRAAGAFPDPGENLEWLQESWSTIVQAVLARGGTVATSSVLVPAHHDLAQTRVELKAVAPVPDGVIDLLERFPHAHLEWHLRDAPDQRWASWGCARWSVSDVIHAEQHRRQWVKEVFERPNDHYDAVWQNTFGLMALGNDDVVGVETISGRVIYVSHDDADAHGAVLGRTVVDFVRRWTQIGCPGPDGVAWELFAGADGIEIAGAAVARWLGWLVPSRGIRKLGASEEVD
jgi:hypothetical protein